MQHDPPLEPVHAVPPPPRPLEEKRGPVADALVQTAQDLKLVGLGGAANYVGNWAYDKLNGPSDPPPAPPPDPPASE
jgi:hypothetical protein